MSTFGVALELLVRGPVGEVPADFEEQLDRVLEEIDALGEVADADYSASLSDGVVTFTGFVETDDLVAAHQRFVVTVRGAIHAAEGSTASWPTFTDRSVSADVQESAPDAGLIDA